MFSFLKTKKSAGIPVSSAVHRLISLANAAREDGEWDRAAEYYREVITADPQLTHIWVQLGHAEKERRRFGDAEAAYTRAAMLSPTDADPLLHLGHIHKLVGNMPGAMRAYLAATRLEPAHPHAMDELRRFLAGATPSGRVDLIPLLRREFWSDEEQFVSTAGPQTPGNTAILFDVSSLIAALMAGRGFADAGICGDRLLPILTRDLGQPSRMCAHVLGQGRWLPITSAQLAQIVAQGQFTD